MTGDGLALWLVITGSALGTGAILWLLKLLIDAACDTAPAEPAPEPDAPVQARPIWPPFPAPHAHTTACTGETLTLTTLQPHRARHAKPRNAA
ncbi:MULTISPECIES: hypothetical protein [Streptomyces]|uniref:hypothetical protein n=1 Tax=Streptomyces TaxID=1883 RepID=UPI0029AF64C3|nr:hypothetical protein [Streptomyces stelliscabiei]MDX2552637.1 hypothetical protein [Streptomyces stelliscabiei]MDX2661321.1 hypothetical protein [Streptomyces stelliscabiei]MDX2788802.1 hypothetical protein [Streptomyces stelliscabiei]